MNTRLAVGTPVTIHASQTDYFSIYGFTLDNLIVMADHTHGYGVGPNGNDPAKAHSRDGWIFVANRNVTKKEESKAVTKFNKGDKVRFNDKSNQAWYGVEGIVEKAGEGTYGSNTLTLTKAATGWASRYTVGSEARLPNNHLELIPEPAFSFEDIQVGDTIRRTQKFTEGTEVREGTVGRKASWYAETKDGSYILAYDSDTAGKENVTLELLNRPEPEPVKARWETAQKGDWLITEGKNGVKRVHTKKKDGDWASVILNRTVDGKPSVGFTRSTESLRNFLKHQTVGEPVLIKG